MSSTAIIEVGAEHPKTTGQTTVLRHHPPIVCQAMREAIRLALRHNLEYREIDELAKAYAARLADINAQGNRTRAAKRLGISRRHFRVMAERSKRLVHS